MFDRESGEMSICCQIAGGAHLIEQAEESFRVFFSRGDYLNIGKFKPTSYAFDRLPGRHRTLYDSPLRADANEAEDCHPGQANRLRLR